MKVQCVGDYYGEPASKFFIWKSEVKELPEELSPELEQALDQGLLIETNKPITTAKQIFKDEVNKAKTLRE